MFSRSVITGGPSVVLTAAIVACGGTPPIADVQGDCANAFQAQVCTWAKMQGDQVLEVGATVPVASIENAPNEADMSWPPTAVAILNLPAASHAATGMTNLTMYWEAEGHPPAPYLTPHFDFHFNLIPDAERMAIDCSDLTKPSTLPAGYSLIDQPLPPDMAKIVGKDTLVGICAPEMGMHSLPTTDLQRSDLFRGTMVIGSYRGKTIFVEPMITRAMLLERKSFELPIPSLPNVSGPHPTTFRADYDAANQSYRFVFAGFTKTS